MRHVHNHGTHIDIRTTDSPHSPLSRRLTGERLQTVVWYLNHAPGMLTAWYGFDQDEIEALTEFMTGHVVLPSVPPSMPPSRRMYAHDS